MEIILKLTSLGYYLITFTKPVTTCIMQDTALTNISSYTLQGLTGEPFGVLQGPFGVISGY